MNIYGLTTEALENELAAHGIKKSRAKLIYKALYKGMTSDFGEMDGIKPETAAALAGIFSTETLETIDRKDDKSACKLLFRLSDGNMIETVMMRHNYGNRLCISTQIGCNMGCRFCESGRLKKVRDLLPHEMVLQIVCARRELKAEINRLVLMGIGEPFDNYENVTAMLDIISDPHGLDIGARRISISTSGIIPAIYSFAQRKPPNSLLISLHAPNDEIRREIMPITNKYGVDALIAAAKDFAQKTNKRVAFEYIMLDGINDLPCHALELADKLNGFDCYVNLIPYNETENSGFRRSTELAVSEFFNILKANKIQVTVRREFGSSLNAACGQLRSYHIKREE